MAIITLTSDIGKQDYLTGAIKGQLLQIDPTYNIIDITHEISPFNYPQAAYICRNAIGHFPEQSFHIILVNLFEKKPEQLLLAYHSNQYLLCADNGLLSMILQEPPEMLIGLPLERNAVKNTLHCAKIFGTAIAAINRGERLIDIGNPDPTISEKNPLRPLLSEAWIEGQIIYIDNFENVVVNITRDEFEAQRKGRPFSIVFKRNEVIEKLCETYADVHVIIAMNSCKNTISQACHS